MTRVAPCLFFDGTCREVMTFYQQCLGGELSVMTFGEVNEASFDAMPDLLAGASDRVIHARLVRGAFTLMASDAMPGMPVQPGSSVWLNVECDDEAEVKRLFSALGEGGQAVMLRPSDMVLTRLRRSIAAPLAAAALLPGGWIQPPVRLREASAPGVGGEPATEVRSRTTRAAHVPAPARNDRAAGRPVVLA